MGARDLTEEPPPEGAPADATDDAAVAPVEAADDAEPFRRAGATLFSLGLVKGSEGNLSTFDGRILRITRAGSELGRLGEDDLVSGGADGPLPGASTDLEVHRRTYAERGPGAVAHAHPPGTVPEDGGGPGAHGVYTFASSLAGAVEAAVRMAREAARGSDEE